MSDQYDVVAEAVRSFRQTHVQQNGETPQQTEDRAFGRDPLRPDFSANQDSLAVLVWKLKNNHPDIRADKVNSVKEKIESGTYENDENLAVAIDRLLDELVA